MNFKLLLGLILFTTFSCSQANSNNEEVKNNTNSTEMTSNTPIWRKTSVGEYDHIITKKTMKHASADVGLIFIAPVFCLY